MAVVAVPFILYLVRFCSSKSCKKNRTALLSTFGIPNVLNKGVSNTGRRSYRGSWYCTSSTTKSQVRENSRTFSTSAHRHIATMSPSENMSSEAGVPGCLPCLGGGSELSKVDDATKKADDQEQIKPFAKVAPAPVEVAGYSDCVIPANADSGAQYFALRNRVVNKFFDGSIGVDDFMARVEMQLWSHGFTGENSIGDKLSPAMSVNCGVWHAQNCLWLYCVNPPTITAHTVTGSEIKRTSRCCRIFATALAFNY